MGKLLSWVVLIALAWLVIHLIAISQRRRERGRDGAGAGGRDAPAGSRAAGRASSGALEGEPIVPCAHCGVFVPASDVVRDGERAYCGVAHRDADRAVRAGAGAHGEARTRPGDSHPRPGE